MEQRLSAYQGYKNAGLCICNQAFIIGRCGEGVSMETTLIAMNAIHIACISDFNGQHVWEPLANCAVQTQAEQLPAVLVAGGRRFS